MSKPTEGHTGPKRPLSTDAAPISFTFSFQKQSMLKMRFVKFGQPTGNTMPALFIIKKKEKPCDATYLLCPAYS
jgi:hypothetical protein